MKLSNKFSPGYIDDIFNFWYAAGKPITSVLYRSMPVWDFTKDKPSLTTLREWMSSDEWVEKALYEDGKVEQAISEGRVLAKVEMFERHSKVGRTMQEMSLEWLEKHKDELTPGTAVRMLVDGIEIEQGAAGIPEALKKMRDMKDEDLMKELSQLIADTPMDITPIDVTDS